MTPSPLSFADLHCHALCGVDDGATSVREMRAMVDASYADGVRILCLTPHFNPGMFGDNRSKANDSFRTLSAYVRQRYPKMALYLGNELRYSRDCVSWLDQGVCRTLGGSRYVLVDFSTHEEKRAIIDGLLRMLAGGYVPILAHPERYVHLSRGLDELKDLQAKGVLLQLDAQSPLGGFGLSVRMRAHTMLRGGFVDFVGSDAHGVTGRPPQLSEAYRHVEKKYGSAYAEAIFRKNAVRLLKRISHEQ